MHRFVKAILRRVGLIEIKIDPFDPKNLVRRTPDRIQEDIGNNWNKIIYWTSQKEYNEYSEILLKRIRFLQLEIQATDFAKQVFELEQLRVI